MTRFAEWPAGAQGAAYALAAGLFLTSLDTTMRFLTTSMAPYQTQFLRYVMGFIVLLPFLLRDGIVAYRPNGWVGQIWRAVVHTAGLTLWFSALPFMPLADVTAIGFTTPLFAMVGAVLFFGERAFWQRWAAAGIGFLGVLVVVAPNMSGAGGAYNLMMLVAAPLFAASALITKALTRRDSARVIVFWQAIGVSAFSLPLALADWAWPTAFEWALLLFGGVLGSLGQFCVARSLLLADVSATQPLKFLTLVWSALFGWMIFAQVPSQTTLAGAAVIFAATTWIARSETQRARREKGS